MLANQRYADFAAYDLLPVAIRRVIQDWPAPIAADEALPSGAAANPRA